MQKIFMQNLKSAPLLKNNKLLQQFSHSPFNHAFQLPQAKKQEILYDEDIISDHQYKKINFNNLKQTANQKNIAYDSDDEDLKLVSFKVQKSQPKCGVEDFYPNGKPQLPDIKKMRNVINKYIEELAKANTDMENKYVRQMKDEHYDIFKEISYSPPVALNIIPFAFQPPTDEQIKKVFDADSKSGNLAFIIGDAKEKKVYGCFGARFRSAQMPSKEGGYTEMIVPEVWSKMSDPGKGMLKLLRKLQEEVYNSGFVVTYARVGNHAYEKYANFHKTTEKYLKMIPSLSVPGAEGVAIDVQTFYGYKDKAKEDITKDEMFFLDNLAIQLANISPTAKKETTASKVLLELEKDSKQNNDFGR